MKSETYKKRLDRAQQEIVDYSISSAVDKSMVEYYKMVADSHMVQIRDKDEAIGRFKANIEVANLLIDRLGDIPRVINHEKGITTLSLTERLSFVQANRL
jgi:hypothetical protein